MKKIILFIGLLFILTGCKNLNKMNIDTIIKDITESKLKLSNEYRTGYKYYLPSNLNVESSSKMNEVLSTSNEKYYLYVDLIGFYYNKDINYSANSDAYYSKSFTYDNTAGRTAAVFFHELPGQADRKRSYFMLMMGYGT